MSGLIPQAFIDELLDRTDIVEVIDRRVALKKAGKNYKACCPFHNEKTPSFNVNPDKQFFHCFGCGAGGNAVSFIMDFENVDFPRAVEILADSLGLEVPKEQQTPAAKQRHKQQQSIYDVMNFAQRFFQQALRQHANKDQAVNYLKQRGVSGEIARDFGVGFAPPGWDNLLKHSLQQHSEKAQQLSGKAQQPTGKEKQKPVKPENRDAIDQTQQQQLLETAGLLVKRETEGYYDRFRDRVMFPIRDNRGRVIAFGGRVLGDDKPKYLNSPETSIFHKQRELYGLYEARRQNNQLDCLVMVEGYMDVVSLFQFGINYAVATLGTASSRQHLEKIFRHTARLVVCFDGDDAGHQAAMRLLETALPAMQDGREIAFLFLPDGEDPDTYVRSKGKEAFEQALKNAKPLEQMLFDKHQTPTSLDSDAAKIRFCNALLSDIALLPGGLFKQSQINRLGKLTQTDPALLEERLFEIAAKTRPSEPFEPSPQNDTPTHPHSGTSNTATQPATQHSTQHATRQASRPVETANEQPQMPVSAQPDANTLLGVSTLLHFPSLAREAEIGTKMEALEVSNHPLSSLYKLIIRAEEETGSDINIAKLFGYLHHDAAMRELLRLSSGLPEPANHAIARQQLIDATSKIEREISEPVRTQKLQQITQKPPSQLSPSEREILKKLGRD